MSALARLVTARRRLVLVVTGLLIVLAGAVTARLDQVKTVVNPYLLPDLQAASVLASASARAASSSARVNIAQLTNRREAERLENQLDLLLGRLARHRNAVVHYEPG